MKQIYILRKTTLLVIALLTILVIGLGFFALGTFSKKGVPVAAMGSNKEFTIITTEYKTQTKDGKVIEVYRWNPGFIVVNKGDNVTLKFFGVHGTAHPFEIKGFGVKGEVRKGQETIVTFTADKKGTYEIVCDIHLSYEDHGPMIGYIIVN